MEPSRFYLRLIEMSLLTEQIKGFLVAEEKRNMEILPIFPLFNILTEFFFFLGNTLLSNWEEASTCDVEKPVPVASDFVTVFLDKPRWSAAAPR